ncbi:GNAT family N-acetyltransferase, cg3035/Rv0428c family [Gordonia neofelifaecis]|uniref:GCN5-like N-acetyltransferase n=1 Tax=Gordonia neofelifaecis NRRL B-59395 TaxID=644548 RepID=F1YJT3_9ACTN|nr:hypothetical protein [Gordonia neofelifaecis]EGD55015.1 GCN5-like N-acetyltransferase [Gordonia neofelifaecis NRRL B-59395]
MATRGPRPALGDRVVIRYRLGDDAPADWRSSPNPPTTGSPTQSDITGILREQSDDAIVVERDGALHRLATSAISSVRLLSRRVVRNSEIREVERALMLAAPARERAESDGWLLNGAGDGLRSAAVAPVDFGATGAGLVGAREWLAARGLPTRVVVADRLLRTSALGATVVGSADLEVLVGPEPTTAAAGEWARIADGVAAVTVLADDDAARAAWRALSFELHHTCRMLNL